MTGNRVTRKALEFKGRMMTLTVLRVGVADPAELETALTTQLARTPEFFRSLPVLIEPDNAPDLDLAGLVDLLKRHSLVPVAVYRPDNALAEQAARLDLGVITDPRGARAAAQPEPAPKGRERQPTRVLTQPVRSGQQIYARGGDLIVVSTVSPGAEVLADGCIHVYGPLRGRALAGAQGDETARIFCQELDAELIAVAGRYRVSEDLDESMRGQRVQVQLQDESLIISPLN